MITTKVLNEISDVVKISVVAEKAGLNKNTILAKCRDRRDLTTTESAKIENFLKEFVIGKIQENESFHFEDYKNLSASEIRKLPSDIKAKVLHEHSRRIAKDFKIIEDYHDIKEF